ncbi:MAG TPA: MFS transporter [Gemmatimonadales bacterium]|nr:MFS transporter [Gemmatimonadales bacterium]
MLVTLDLVGFAIVLPLLASYGARHTPHDALVGVLVASYSLLHFLLAPAWGRLSDRVGRRPVLLLGFAGSAVSYLLFGLAGSFVALLASRVVAGVSGATVNVAQAALADVTAPAERSRAMGLIGAAFGIAFVIGPALAGVTSRLGDAAPGLLAAGFATVNLALAARFLPETRRGSSPPRRVPLPWTGVRTPLAIAFLETLAFTTIYVALPLLAERRLGYDRAAISWLYAMMGLTGAVVQGWLVGRLAPRMGEARLIAAGGALMAGGLALVPTAAGNVLAAALVALAAGSGLIIPAVAAWVSRHAPADSQGHALGRLQSATSVARIVGPVAAGAASGSLGLGAAFQGAALAAVIAAGLGAVLQAGISRGSRTAAASGPP